MGVYASSNKVINRYEIREERNEHLPNFHTTIDNYDARPLLRYMG